MLKNILFFLDIHQRLKAIKLIFLGLISSVMEVFNLAVLVLILNYFLQDENKNNENFLYKFLDLFNVGKENFIIYVLLCFFVIVLLKILILIYVSWSEAKFLAKFKESLSNRLFKIFLSRNAYQTLKKNSSEYLRNFTSEIDQAGIFFFCLLKLILDIILVTSLFIFLLFFDLYSSISTIGVLIILSTFYYSLVKKPIYRWGQKRIYSQKKKIQFVNESFSAIKYIKILSRENFFFKKFKKQNFELAKITFKMGFLNTIPRFFLELFLFISIILILIILFKSNYEYQDIIKIVSVYIAVSFRLIPSANRILGNSQNIKFVYPGLLSIRSQLKTKPLIKNKIGKKINFNKLINVKVKKFNYNPKSKFSLNNINLIFRKKEKIGIIGPSGCGKSTLIDIICGFIKTNNGDVLVDNNSIHNNLNSWQKLIGYIPQKIVIMNDSLKNNILFGLKENKFSNKAIMNIIRKTNLIDLYKKLPRGLNEKISQEGLNISGGEIQRIGIARALINNPEIIFLDESTSALDTFTENKILSEINSLNKTIIFVSHRINSLRYCDRIYYIKNGVIKDEGKFKKFNKQIH